MLQYQQSETVDESCRKKIFREWNFRKFCIQKKEATRDDILCHVEDTLRDIFHGLWLKICLVVKLVEYFENLP